MTAHMCGHCSKWSGGCYVGGGTTAYGERCKFIPSKWEDKHWGKGVWLGSRRNPEEGTVAGSFHVTHHGEKVRGEKTIRTKDGPVSFKKGEKQSAKGKGGKKKK